MSLVTLNWNNLSTAERNEALQRTATRSDAAIVAKASAIITTVRRNGDRALNVLTRRYDNCRPEQLRVSQDEIDRAICLLPAPVKQAIDTSIRNVRAFHLAQIPGEISLEIQPGVRCERRNRPIDAVGLYVPSGSAPLPSTAVMLGVPATVAACPVRVVCTPPLRDGSVHPATIYAALQSGVNEIYKVGGAQAIAAMAYGTETIPAVNKIFGPGNAWVTAAKNIVAHSDGGVAIDMPAGPSEVMVIADAGANPSFVAADLLAQAEHGADSQVILATESERLAAAVAHEIEKQLAALSRQQTISAALQHCYILIVENIAQALEVCNAYAPEHLILLIDDARDVLGQISNAGAIFVGPYSPESAGDYCSGANHVLPTYGAAKNTSGLGVEQFMRHVSIQELTRDGLTSLAPSIVALAYAEGLDAHAAAVQIRLHDCDIGEIST